ncbi:MAG: M90 family metallopeptidase [Spirochaetales bacterium]
MLLFDWLPYPFSRAARRRKLLATSRLADDLWTELVEQHPIVTRLAVDDLNRLRDLSTIFLAEKQFETVRGLTLDELQKASLALQACLPVLNLGIDWYNDWSTLILVPKEFKEKMETPDGHLVHETNEELGGEVMPLGPVILSWRDIEDSGWGDGYNVVIHEMAHKLDGRSGGVDGCPPLHRGMDFDEWKTVFTQAFTDLERKARRLGRRAEKELAIDPYAATDPGEFFAVCSETFFETPKALAKEYPEVYRLLTLFYRQEPIPPVQA